MKSLGKRACPINMKGKKTKKLTCGCCSAINFKEEILKDIHKKEMSEETIPG